MHETQDSTPAYKDFIHTIAAQEQAWALAGSEGLAISSSHEQEERDVIPFWSEEALAKAVAIDDWAGYQPKAIDLVEFMEAWLVRLHNEEVLAGINWDASLSGQETEPLVIALDLVRELEANGKQVFFTRYKSLGDYREQVREASGLS